MEPNYFVGLDLGQTHDYTALAVVAGTPQDDSLFLPHLQRFRLDTPYPDMIGSVTRLVLAPPLVRAPLVPFTSCSSRTTTTRAKCCG